MKILGLFLLILAMYFSWGLFNGKGALIPEGTHIEIQQTLSDKIISVIAESHPEAYNIEMLDFWTESIDQGSVEAHFEFAFEEKNSQGEQVKISKKGKALIVKTKEEKGSQFWEAKDASLEGQKIEFTKGLTFEAKKVSESN